MKIEEVAKLVDECDVVIVTKTPRSLRMHEILDKSLLDLTGLTVKAASLDAVEVAVTDAGAVFSVDANGAPVEATN